MVTLFILIVATIKIKGACEGLLYQTSDALISVEKFSLFQYCILYTQIQTYLDTYTYLCNLFKWTAVCLKSFYPCKNDLIHVPGYNLTALQSKVLTKI